MKISVVTVCFRSRATIGRTIESFLKQNYQDKEMLIVDGGSTDGTLDVIQSHACDSIRVISERDHGTYDAMNKGLKNFSGDAVGFLNSDDVYHDASVLERIAQGLAHADAVYGDLVMIKDHTKRRAARTWNAGAFVAGSFRSGWMPPHPTFYVRRALAEMVGRFNLDYRISADYDFMLRALELHRPRVRYIPHPLVDFMVGGTSTSGIRAVIEGNLQCLHSRRRHLGAPRIDLALLSKPTRKLRQLHWR